MTSETFFAAFTREAERFGFLRVVAMTGVHCMRCALLKL